MGRCKEPEYRPHPLLEELRPRLKASARKHLEKSLLRVGQLHPVLVTQDNYILDGRERFELMTRQNLKPQVKHLYFYSGVDAEVLPNAGYSLEEELQSCREVIEETGRGKWQNSQARREKGQGTEIPTTDQGTEASAMDQGTKVLTTDQGTEGRLSPRSFKAVPCDGRQVAFRAPKKLIEHLELMAIKTGASRRKGTNSKQSTGPTVNEYIRDLCWADFIKHLSDHQ